MPVEPENKEKPEPRREDTRRRILEAAMRLFSEQGYARTTTRALAQAAGITEMTLFRYFASKEKLFEATIEMYGGKAVAGEMQAQLTGRYGEDLLILGNLMMNILKQRGDAMRLMICESSHFPAMAGALAQNPRILRQMLAGYLQQQMDAGQVRSLNVDAAAHIFWGMLLAYRLSVDLLAEPGVGGASEEEVVAHFVDIFIHGTAAGDGKDGERD